ncbi:hypothetical protein [Roseovarius sp.]|uniref:hypothetical protein n=1 Tax=Roseovarius sp. TaxID=1486281 RepID=UPI003BAD3E77
MKDTNNRKITVAEAAEITGRSTRWIKKLKAEGYIAEYTVPALGAGIAAYYEDKLKEAQKSEVANKASLARTREIELRTAERARKLVPIDDSLMIMSHIQNMVRAEFAGFPAQITHDPDLQRRMQTALDDIFERASRKAKDLGEALRSGRFDMEAS